jgi:outer membrane protein assembly factor BamB
VPVAGADDSGGTDREESDRGKGRDRGRSENLAPHRFVLLAIDRATGKTLWERVAIEATPGEGHHPGHGFASASPFTDGERVYAHFGSRGLFAFTLDGEPAWQRTDFGSMRTRMGFGEGSSPAIHGDSIVVPWDQEGPSYLIALDRRTGKTLWKKDRDETSAWGTPLIVDHKGRPQVITTGEKFARSHDLATGEEIWRCTGQTGRPIASPVAAHGIAIIGSGFRGSYLGAFRLDGKGDLKGTDAVAWTLSRHTPDVPSPLISETRVYFHAGRSGVLSCHDVVSGKAHYAAERVEGLGNVYASPVGAAGRIYLTGRDGVTVTIEDGDRLKILATGSVGEPVDATPALAGKDVFIRGEKHLFAIRG